MDISWFWRRKWKFKQSHYSGFKFMFSLSLAKPAVAAVFMRFHHLIRILPGTTWSLVLTKCYPGYQAEKNEIGRTYMGVAYSVLVGKCDGKRPRGRPRHGWEGHIKMYLTLEGACIIFCNIYTFQRDTQCSSTDCLLMPRCQLYMFRTVTVHPQELLLDAVRGAFKF